MRTWDSFGFNFLKRHICGFYSIIFKTVSSAVPLKVHKNENFFGSDFKFCTISLLVMLKY